LRFFRLAAEFATGVSPILKILRMSS